MKATISREELLSGLRRILNVVSTRTTLPILSNVLLEAEGNSVALTTTDLEVTIRTEIAALVEEPGATTLPARKFGQITGVLPDGDIVLETDVKEQTSLSCGKAFFRILGLDANEFPRDSEFAEEWAFTLAADELRKSLSKVSYCSSTDETRHVLNGILLSLRDGILTIAATDGRRLALVEKSLSGDSYPDGDVILPPKLVVELEKTLASDQQVNVRLSESRVAFATPRTVITSKLIEGNYPNYRQVIPAEFNHAVTFPRETFATVLNRVSMVVSDSSAAVKLKIENAAMEVSASSHEFGESREPMEASYEGDPLTISFNPVFFSEPLRFLECDQLIMQFNDEYSPVSLSGDEGFLYVLMPMRG